MPEIKDEAELPTWMIEALQSERREFPDSKLPQHLGAPGYRVHRLEGSRWWVWDNGTGGVLVSDDGKRWVNASELNDEHPQFSPRELGEIHRLIVDGWREQRAVTLTHMLKANPALVTLVRNMAETLYEGLVAPRVAWARSRTMTDAEMIGEAARIDAVVDLLGCTEDGGRGGCFEQRMRRHVVGRDEQTKP